MTPSEPLLPRAVPPAGAHGGDGPAVAAALGLAPEELLDLSQNMNPLAPPPGPLVLRHLDAVGRYPDDRGATRLLAQALDVDPGRVLLTNGGSEAIHLLTTVLGGRVRSEPEFGLHPRGPDDAAGPLWRTDPHSPSGRLAAPGETADVWDEAFYALATGRWTAPGRGAGTDRSLVVGSLTKTFACPGLRLGYVVLPESGPVARPDLDLGTLRAAQPHWSVSALALAVLPDLLEGADLAGWAAGIAGLRADLVGLLEGAGLAVDAADASWVLVDSPGLRERLAPHGVLVRDCTSFGLPGVHRMAVPDADGLERVARALERISGPGRPGPAQE